MLEAKCDELTSCEKAFKAQADDLSRESRNRKDEADLLSSRLLSTTSELVFVQQKYDLLAWEAMNNWRDMAAKKGAIQDVQTQLAEAQQAFSLKKDEI